MDMPKSYLFCIRSSPDRRIRMDQLVVVDADEEIDAGATPNSEHEKVAEKKTHTEKFRVYSESCDCLQKIMYYNL